MHRLARNLGRTNEDFLTKGDLDAPETKGLQKQLADQLQRTDIAAQARFLLEQSLPALSLENIGSHILWIELRPNGGLSLHAFPEHVDALLEERLFSQHRVTLLCPPGCEKTFPETIPKGRVTTVIESGADDLGLVSAEFPENDVREVLRNPPTGKTIVLLGSKRIIEQLFVEYTEALEAKGVTLICQGLSGGQNRMEAEFIAASSPALWLLTPWTYEGTDLPPGTLDRLVLDTLPFDHPGQPLMQRRKEHYKSAFGEYCLPRVEHRLFRLLRTFCRHRKEDAGIVVLDKRIREKEYGRQLRGYMEQFRSEKTETIVASQPVQQKLF